MVGYKITKAITAVIVFFCFNFCHPLLSSSFVILFCHPLLSFSFVILMHEGKIVRNDFEHAFYAWPAGWRAGARNNLVSPLCVVLVWWDVAWVLGVSICLFP